MLQAMGLQRVGHDCMTELTQSGEPSNPLSSVGKESACNAGDLGSIPGLGRSSGEEKATHSSILAWRIPWTAWSMGLQRVGHDFHFTSLHTSKDSLVVRYTLSAFILQQVKWGFNGISNFIVNLPMDYN